MLVFLEPASFAVFKIRSALIRLFLLFLPGLSGVFFQACTENTANKPIIESFPVTQVLSLDTNLYHDYVAEIASIQNVEIRAKVSGFLEKIYVDEGKFVKKGQLLFKINEAGYREDLNRTKALYRIAASEARSAEIELTNVTELYRKKIVSATELEIAKNKFASANAKVEEALANEESAEHKISYTQIRAPFDGFINRIPFKIGSLIDEGTLMTSLSQNNEMFAYFDVSEKEYLAYADNLAKDSASSKAVDLILANGQLLGKKGHIETIESEIDGSTGNIAFRARFPNPNQILKHGASGKVRMTKRLSNVLAIPQKATFEIQDKLYVYVLGKDNKLEVRNITASHRLSHIFIISQGLKDKERIVYEGIQNVEAGKVIQPMPVAMREIIKDLAAQ
jgi:membrane fusion protein (multidrug efflux system)